MRRNIKLNIVVIIIIILMVVITSCNGVKDSTNVDNNHGEQKEDTKIEENESLIGIREEKDNPLPIPPLLENKSNAEGEAEFDLNVQYGEHEFIEGQKADTLGYNGDYLGPIIKVNKGDNVKINVNNELDEETTVHWHGLNLIGEMDGGPHQIIDPKGTWNPEFTIEQPAATLWYHPHIMGKTGVQVYKGLAGLFYIEDENSERLNIPKEYGINDIPLIVQDKRFTEDGNIPYDLDMMDIRDGFMGNTVLINGAIDPELYIRNEVIRFRILNGSNARAYDFSFSDDIKFYQIASDGGFLKESIEMDSLYLAAAERAEILVDLSAYKEGDQLTFKDSQGNLMYINIVEEVDGSTEIPKELVEIEDYNRDEVVRTREFIMSGMGPMVTINGKQMDMDRIDEEVNLNELEEWIITNESPGMGMMGRGRGMMDSMPHPFHVHGVQFRIIERNGEAPPLNERGWKDTVLLESGDEVKFLAKFKKEGLFMYHCHILEHEDSGMMGQFLIE